MNTQHFLIKGLAAALFLSSVVACQNSNEGTIRTDRDLAALGIQSEGSLLLTNSVRVLGPLGEPLQGAQVLIGSAPGVPFQGNELVADNQGVISIPAEWTSPLPVTVEALGYVRTSFTDVLPEGGDFRVAFADSAANLNLKGTPTDYRNIRRDGKVDFGLVMKTFTRQELVGFDLAFVLATDNDSISILGFNLNIPSNLTLPRQQESYFFPIELDKPNYRLPIKRPGTHSFMAAHGQFPMNQVFDKIRGGASIFDVANELTFLRGGTKDIAIVSGSVSSNISVSQIEFTGTTELKAPAFGGGKLVLGLGAMESNGLFYPSDMKILKPNQKMKLKVPAQGNAYKLAVLLNEAPPVDYAIPDFNQLSLVLQTGADDRVAQFLPMIAKPQVENNVATMTPPAATAGIRPVATYLILSELETVTGGAVPLVKTTRLWELQTASWVSSVNLPEFQFDRKPNRKYKWEVIYLGQDETLAAGSPDFTHLTRNSFIF